ncbi:adenylate kinase [Holotrichia oblita]|uniref:Adenylate kinase n=2 Tax=Holotrichia oblita TaxID=644536 RepID=A0ACB9SSV5_HOLOL|nr:adenylate kinase [Holotrichia oblita]KAI4458305.1 adenylate kinase [Holotrichia oblita]
MSDGTRVKLSLPAWHIPYLEKHKIMELLHELTRELVIQQPVDHLMFVKQLLARAAKNVGVSRVIVLCSPKVNSLEVAKLVAQQTYHYIVTEDTILENLNVANRNQVRPSILAMCLSYLLHTPEAQSNGWILVDCIKTAAEAKKLLQAGVIPTHVLHFIPPFTPNLNEALYCNVHESWPAYRREVMNIRSVFKNKVVEIHLKQRLIHEVVAEVISVVKNMKRLGCPKQLRVVILGPRGSGRNTQAALIAQKLGLIHINFHYLLCQAWNADGEFNDTLRAAEREVCFRPDLLSEVINRRILEEDCLSNGWVLTGYPFNVADFKYLDILDTPPNRLVWLYL